MNKELFVQNVEFFCKRKGVSRTEACRESGAGERLIENTKRGSVPSVEKVQTLAQYLGVTVSELIGETSPGANPNALSDLPSDTHAVAKAYAAATPELQAAVRRVLGVE